METPLENKLAHQALLPGFSAHLEQAFGGIYVDMNMNGNIQNKICSMSSGSGSSPFQPRSSSWSRLNGLPFHAQASAGKKIFQNFIWVRVYNICLK